MNCPSCGRENLAEASFCMACATSLVLSAEQAPSPLDVFPVSSGFVGRQREMAELGRALEDTLSGHGRLVMLVGEPGIGKTRTTQELASYAETRGVRVLWGWCYEEAGAPPYWPWVLPIRSYVRQTNPEQWRSQMGPGATDIAEMVPELRDKLPGLEIPPALDPDSARFRLFDSIATFLKNAAQSQPLMLVLDDLHWADQASLLLLEFVAREIANSHMLVVGSYRNIEVSRQHPLSQTLGGLVREGNFTRILLSGLAQPDVKRLIEATAGVSLSTQMVEAIHARTEGNPFFVAQVAETLNNEDSRASPAQLTNIPEGVRDAIARRLNRLSSACKQVLTTGSIIGREFTVDLLERLIDDYPEDDFLEALEEALAAGVLEEISGVTVRYQFSHALIQETLAAEVSALRRGCMHQRIAESLEDIYGVDVESHADELAHHYAEAVTLNGTRKLVHYSLLAGEQALVAYAYEQAVIHFQRGLEAKVSQPMDDEAAALLFGLGRAQAATAGAQDFQEVWDILARPFDYYVETGDINRAVSVAESLRSRLLGRVAGPAKSLSRALSTINPDSHDAGRFLVLYGFALQGGVDAEADYLGAEEALKQALVIAHREKDPLLECQALWCMAAGNDRRNLYREALEWSLKAINLAQSIGAYREEHAARNWACVAALCLGYSDQARLHAKAMLDLTEQMRDRQSQARGYAPSQAQAYVWGDWKACREFNEKGLAASPRDFTHLVVRAQLEHELGDFSLGEAYLVRLLEAARMAPSFPQAFTFPAAAIPVIARMTGNDSRFDIAEVAGESAISSPWISPEYSVVARVGPVLMAVDRDDPEGAAEQYQVLLPLRGIFLRWILKSVDHILGLLAHTMGKIDLAVDHFDSGVEFCRNARFRPELAWTCYDYANVLAQRSGPGDHAKAAELLEEAMGITQELGMRPLMERVTVLQETAQSPPARAPIYPVGLTQREVEVLHLISQGKSNREIAEELTISLNTVLRHVSHILAKTGAANRTEAAAYANQNGLL
ncbi:MAG: AAA family ATPase [Dehalococcoidia bacterium]